MMSGQDEMCEIGVSSSKIVLLLMRKNTSSQEVKGENQTEKIVTDKIKIVEAEIEAKFISGFRSSAMNSKSQRRRSS